MKPSKGIICQPSYKYREFTMEDERYQSCERGRFIVNFDNFDVTSWAINTGAMDQGQSEVIKALKDETPNDYIRGHSINGKKGGQGLGYATALITKQDNTQHFNQAESFIGPIAQQISTNFVPGSSNGRKFSEHIDPTEEGTFIVDKDKKGVFGLLFETSFGYADQGIHSIIPQSMHMTFKICWVPNALIGQHAVFFQPKDKSQSSSSSSSSLPNSLTALDWDIPDQIRERNAALIDQFDTIMEELYPPNNGKDFHFKWQKEEKSLTHHFDCKIKTESTRNSIEELQEIRKILGPKSTLRTGKQAFGVCDKELVCEVQGKIKNIRTYTKIIEGAAQNAKVYLGLIEKEYRQLEKVAKKFPEAPTLLNAIEKFKTNEQSPAGSILESTTENSLQKMDILFVLGKSKKGFDDISLKIRLTETACSAPEHNDLGKFMEAHDLMLEHEKIVKSGVAPDPNIEKRLNKILGYDIDSMDPQQRLLNRKFSLVQGRTIYQELRTAYHGEMELTSEDYRHIVDAENAVDNLRAIVKILDNPTEYIKPDTCRSLLDKIKGEDYPKYRNKQSDLESLCEIIKLFPSLEGAKKDEWNALKRDLCQELLDVIKGTQDLDDIQKRSGLLRLQDIIKSPSFKRTPGIQLVKGSIDNELATLKTQKQERSDSGFQASHTIHTKKPTMYGRPLPIPSRQPSQALKSNSGPQSSDNHKPKTTRGPLPLPGEKDIKKQLVLNQNLMNELGTFKELSGNLSTQMEELKVKNDKLRDELNEFRKENHVPQETWDQLVAQHNEVKKKLEELEVNHDLFSTYLKELEESNNNFENKLYRDRDSCNNLLGNNIDTARSSYDILKRMLDDLNDSLNRLKGSEGKLEKDPIKNVTEERKRKRGVSDTGGALEPDQKKAREISSSSSSSSWFSSPSSSPSSSSYTSVYNMFGSSGMTMAPLENNSLVLTEEKSDAMNYGDEVQSDEEGVKPMEGVTSTSEINSEPTDEVTPEVSNPETESSIKFNC